MWFPSPQGGSETCPFCGVAHVVIPVSIPSRRVGDGRDGVTAVAEAVFPSPQGGSETDGDAEFVMFSIPFPSPQGGSETDGVRRLLWVALLVSIPSRRVGDGYRRSFGYRFG